MEIFCDELQHDCQQQVECLPFHHLVFGGVGCKTKSSSHHDIGSCDSEKKRHREWPKIKSFLVFSWLEVNSTMSCVLGYQQNKCKWQLLFWCFDSQLSMWMPWRLKQVLDCSCDTHYIEPTLLHLSATFSFSQRIFQYTHSKGWKRKKRQILRPLPSSPNPQFISFHFAQKSCW